MACVENILIRCFKELSDRNIFAIVFIGHIKRMLTVPNVLANLWIAEIYSTGNDSYQDQPADNL